ncbi:MAG: hypothetical protein MESAZ_01475 [Saezia sanguinis]
MCLSFLNKSDTCAKIQGVPVSMRIILFSISQSHFRNYNPHLYGTKVILLMKWLQTLWSLFFNAGYKWSQDNCQRFAASLSYYTVFSLAPLLVIIVAVVGLVYEGDARLRLVEQVQGILGPQIAQVVNSLIVSASRPFQSIFASFIALFIFLIGATGVLVELRYALNTVWGFAQEKEDPPTIWTQILRIILVRLFTLLMVVLIGFLILASLFISTYFSVANAWLVAHTPGIFPVSRFLDPLFTITTTTFFFYIVMMWLPAHRPPRRCILPGAFVAAVLFHVGKALMSFYLARAVAASVYGAASSVVLLMLWVYFSASIFLYGAELAASIQMRRLEKAKNKLAAALPQQNSVAPETADAKAPADAGEQRQP